MASGEIRLHIVAALECEARPLIRALDLAPAPAKTVRPLYLGEEVALTIAGVGRSAAEAAVKFLTLSESARYALGKKPGAEGGDVAWLNVGVGGHRERPIGEGILAHRVEDAGWSRAWFPRFVFDPPCPTETVRTIDHVERNYLDPVVYEMEAAGFAAAAASTSPAELIHVYKVISDGPNAPVERISEAVLETLIEARTGEIVSIAGMLVNLSAELAGAKSPPPGFEELAERWRFTQTQQHRLRRLLVRWHAAMGADSPVEAAREARHAREVLLLLERALRAASPGDRGSG